MEIAYGIQAMVNGRCVHVMVSREKYQGREFWLSSEFNYFKSKRERNNALRRLKRHIKKGYGYHNSWTAAWAISIRIKERSYR